MNKMSHEMKSENLNNMFAIAIGPNILNQLVKYVQKRYIETQLVAKKQSKSKKVSKRVCKYNMQPKQEKRRYWTTIHKKISQTCPT
jgi:hypothetical protein